MKIIGGHDYYDKAMQHGIDTTVVLMRTDRVLENFSYFPPLCPLPRTLNSRDWRRQDFGYVIVVIADHVYSGIRYTPYHSLEKGEIVWSYESYQKLLQKIGCKEPEYLGWHLGNKHINGMEYFEVKTVADDVKSFMLDNGLSILSGNLNRENIWTGNPSNLKQLGFYKVMDAFTLYQTLDMWVSGVLSNGGNRTVEITDDKIKIQKHGFDLRASFRKGKSV